MPHVCYATITGSVQGDMTSGASSLVSVGQSQQPSHADECLVQAIKHSIIIPRDPQSGQPTAQRVHQPLTITKLVDKCSPLLYTALCNGENLTSVELHWYRISDTGGSEKYFTTKLTNAILVNIETYMPNALDPANNAYKHMEDISFSYESIEWTHELGSTAGNDSWSEPATAG